MHLKDESRILWPVPRPVDNVKDYIGIIQGFSTFLRRAATFSRACEVAGHKWLQLVTVYGNFFKIYC
jgi:hypothetical protein